MWEVPLWLSLLVNSGSQVDQVHPPIGARSSLALPPCQCLSGSRSKQFSPASKYIEVNLWAEPLLLARSLLTCLWRPK